MLCCVIFYNTIQYYHNILCIYNYLSLMQINKTICLHFLLEERLDYVLIKPLNFAELGYILDKLLNLSDIRLF